MIDCFNINILIFFVIRNKNARVQLAQGYSLKINKALESDTGTYTCRICNSASRQQISESTSYDHVTMDTLNSNADRNNVCDERSAFLKVLGKKFTKLRNYFKIYKNLKLKYYLICVKFNR